MRGTLSLKTVLSLIFVLVFVAGIVLSAQAAQNQGPVEESQKNEQSTEKRNKLTSQLFQAIQSNSLEQAKELIAKGADVSARANQAMTMLHVAAAAGNKEIVSLLLTRGAAIDVKDDSGRTSLHYAVGITVPNVPRGHNPAVVQLLLDKDIDINTADKQGLAPLHYAVVREYKEAVTMLLKRGALVSVKDNAGRTPLHYAAGAAALTRNNKLFLYGLPKDWSSDIAQLLLENGADINDQDAMGWTPLYYATSARHENAIRFFIDKGADIACVDNRGYTPYLWAYRFLVYHESISGPDYRHRFADQIYEILGLLRKDNYYFVATNGNDTNLGTVEHPLKTVYAAIDIARPNDVIIVRAGTYYCKQPINLDRSGEEGKPIVFKAYPGEVPILDFSSAQDTPIDITGAYWHLKGLTITRGGRFGIRIHGKNAHHNILEQVVAYDDEWGGILIDRDTSHNLILNCDSYKNFDIQWNGEESSGFMANYFVGQGNIFIGDRAWNNSDGGFVTWLAGNAVEFERCYAWNTGKNIWNHPFFTGNGGGFRLGGGEGKHVLVDCGAWDNTIYGFGLNGNQSGVVLDGCISFLNRTNYWFPGEFYKYVDLCVFRNSISYKSGRNDRIDQSANSQGNSWDVAPGFVLTDDDFLSLDDSMMAAPRNPDGSIPQNDFLRLAPGSAAIDKGVDVGMPFVGVKPDLGAFEYDPNDASSGYVKMLHQAVRDHDVKQIEQLLVQGEGINDKDWLGYTPLHWAVYFGYSDLIELLISKGADPDVQSNTGRYALEIARAMAYPELEALLRKLGAKAGDETPNESRQAVGESTDR